jgi:hypothetical protein
MKWTRQSLQYYLCQHIYRVCDQSPLNFTISHYGLFTISNRTTTDKLSICYQLHLITTAQYTGEQWKIAYSGRMPISRRSTSIHFSCVLLYQKAELAFVCLVCSGLAALISVRRGTHDSVVKEWAIIFSHFSSAELVDLSARHVEDSHKESF